MFYCESVICRSLGQNARLVQHIFYPDALQPSSSFNRTELHRTLVPIRDSPNQDQNENQNQDQTRARPAIQPA